MPQTARTAAFITTALSLGIVLDQQQTMSAADIPHPLCIGTTTVQVDYHHRARALGDVPLYLPVINLQRSGPRFHQYWHQPVLGDGQYGGDEGISRYDDLVAFMHQSHLDIGPINERKRVEPVAHSHTMVCADEGGSAAHHHAWHSPFASPKIGSSGFFFLLLTFPRAKYCVDFAMC